MEQKRKCSDCGAANATENVRCYVCGATLSQLVLCPNCGHDNPQGYEKCGKCGTLLVEEKRTLFGTEKPEPVIRKRYPALRTIASTIEVFAYIVLILIGILVIIVGAAAGGKGLFGALVVGAIIGGLIWIFLKSYSELIYVQLDIEENTRRTSEAIDKFVEKSNIRVD